MQTIILSDEQANLLRSIVAAHLEEVLGDLNQGNLSDYSADVLNERHDLLEATLLDLQSLEQRQAMLANA
jgi:hypothetical protein